MPPHDIDDDVLLGGKRPSANRRQPTKKNPLAGKKKTPGADGSKKLGVKRLDGSSRGFITIPVEWDELRSGMPQLEAAYRKIEAVSNWYADLFEVVKKERVARLLADAKRRHAPLDVMLVLSEIDSLIAYWQQYAEDARNEMGRIDAAARRLQEEQRDDGELPIDDSKDETTGGARKRRSNGKKNDNNNKNKNNGKTKKKGADASKDNKSGACRFMSIPYDDVKNPGSAYNRVDDAYEWYEDFFVSFNYDRMYHLEKIAPTVGAPESAAVALGMLRVIYGELQKRFIELHRERSRLYVLAMQEHTRAFVDSDTRAVIKADVENEGTIRKLFREKKLEYGNNIMVHRFMALMNRMLRETAYDFMVNAAQGAQTSIDETFRRLDYDPREDNFFVTFGGSDDVTIKFQIQVSGYPDAHIGRGGIMPFNRFINEHNNTIVIVDSIHEDVNDVLFDGRTATKRAPSLRGRLQRPRFADERSNKRDETSKGFFIG